MAHESRDRVERVGTENTRLTPSALGISFLSVLLKRIIIIAINKLVKPDWAANKETRMTLAEICRFS